MVSSNELGKFKLENNYKETLFLAPKVYTITDVDGKTMHKVKYKFLMAP